MISEEEGEVEVEEQDKGKISRKKFMKCLLMGAYSLLLPKPVWSYSETGKNDFQEITPLEDLVNFYLTSANKNLLSTETPEGDLTLIRPSPAYPEIYCRDSVLAALGLGGQLLLGSYWWFTFHQNKNGQIPTCISLRREADFRNDESTLFYILLGWKIKKEGKEVDKQALEKAWKYLQGRVKDGKFTSSGPFSYWADNLKIEKDTVVPYNQGLYILALEALGELGFPIPQEEKEKAKKFYLEAVDNFPYQDISGLFPEVLSRWLFGRGIIPEDKVLEILEIIDRWISTAAVYYPDGKLAGIKTISMKDGKFLPMEKFAVLDLAHPGDYQNGGNWPLWNLAGLILAFKISGNEKYKETIEVLIRHELQDQVSKEYWHLGEANLGKADEIRFNYSWNALIYPLLEWGGIISSSAPRAFLSPARFGD